MLCLFFKKLTSKLSAKLLRIMNGRWVLDFWVFLIDRWLGELIWRAYLERLLGEIAWRDCLERLLGEIAWRV
jgi:hypothetical protein